MNFHLGPNCIVYPLDYASIKGGLQRGLQILINLGQQDVKLQQGIVLGHNQKAPSEDIMITQEDIFGVNIVEPWAPGEVEEEVLRGNEKRFYHLPCRHRSSGTHQIVGCGGNTRVQESISGPVF